MSRSEEIPENGTGTLRNFGQLVAALEEGQLHEEATQLMQDVIRDLNHALTIDRKASATMTLTIKLTADRGVIETVSDIKVKQPPRVRGRSMLYVANGKFLSASNPNQLSLPLRTVSGPEPELRVAQ